MKALKINTIKQEEIRTTKIIQSRMKGSYNVNTIVTNQTNNLLNKVYNEQSLFIIYMPLMALVVIK